uniref:Uncharacterized protein n=1 Tax=Ranid herpesvirus 4 TaxID=2849006 RepID=A0A8F3CIL5_9VIRU|nr:MAG: hypothetical protein [Ranid herpesvirus 4]
MLTFYYLMLLNFNDITSNRNIALYAFHDLICNDNTYTLQTSDRLVLHNDPNVQDLRTSVCTTMTLPANTCSKIYNAYSLMTQYVCMPVFVYRLLLITCTQSEFQAFMDKYTLKAEYKTITNTLISKAPTITGHVIVNAGLCLQPHKLQAQRQECKSKATTDYCLDPIKLRKFFLEESPCHVHIQWLLESFGVPMSSQVIFNNLLNSEKDDILPEQYCDDIFEDKYNADRYITRQRSVESIIPEDSLLNTFTNQVKQKDNAEDICSAVYSYN